MKKILVLAMASLAFGSVGCAALFNSKVKPVAMTTSPDDAEVIIDGMSRGRTPLTLELQPNRSYTITFRKPGFADNTQVLTNQVGTTWVVLDVLAGVLSEHAGHTVSLKPSVRGERARFLEMAQRNAGAALTSRLASRHTLLARFDDLQKVLELTDMPRRLECFDISHTMGEATVASCVVFGPEGPEKSHYRRFNIAGITPGDDYAAALALHDEGLALAPRMEDSLGTRSGLVNFALVHRHADPERFVREVVAAGGQELEGIDRSWGSYVVKAVALALIELGQLDEATVWADRLQQRVAGLPLPVEKS